MQTDLPGTEKHGSSPERFRWLLLGVALLTAVALALLANRLPAPASATAPEIQFSSGRAMKDVHAIATEPHPIGSPEIETTRRYLISRMTQIGLDPEVRTQTAIVQRARSTDVVIGGQTRNIIGELKGSNPALPAVLVMAHYDTAPHSPGAGDDTAGIAVALEVARALKVSGPLRRSVIFLFTDGEEAGLLGATAFFESDPLRRRIGPIINLEARGDSGKAFMFQTSTNNRALIEAYGRNVRSPAADSLMVTIYKQMPNDTDLTPALERNHTGMNFAFVGHQMAYHTPLSTAAKLNSGSVQHMGDQVLPVVRHFAGTESLDRSGGDMVFADLFGQYLIVYPSWLGWLLAILVTGATFAMVGVAVARHSINWRDALAGAGGLLTLFFGMATLLMLALRLVALLLRDVTSPYALIGQFGWLLPASILLSLGIGALLISAAAHGQRWTVTLSLGIAGMVAALLGGFSLAPLVVGVAAALFAVASVGRRPALNGWFAGAVALVGLLALFLQVLLPNGAHALVWPLLLLTPILWLLLFRPARAAQPAYLAAITLPAALLAGLMARSGYDFFVMIGATMPAVLAPFALLTALALTPLIWSSPKLLRIGALCIAVGFAICVVAGIRGQTPSVASPEMVEAFYIADFDKGSAAWASGKLDSTGWVKAALGQDGGTPKLQSIAPLAKDAHWVADAKPSAFVRPSLIVAAAGRAIEVRASNANDGRYLRIFLKPTVDLTGLRLMNRPINGTLKAGTWSQLIFHASGKDEVHLKMKAAQPGALEARLVEVRDTWPAGSQTIALPPHLIPYRRAGNSMIMTRTMAQW